MNSCIAVVLLLALSIVFAANQKDSSEASFYGPVRVDKRCGPYFEWAACDKSECCSKYGWCGTSDDHCNWYDEGVADQDRDYESPDPSNTDWTPATFPTEATYTAPVDQYAAPADQYAAPADPYVAPAEPTDSYAAPATTDDSKTTDASGSESQEYYSQDDAPKYDAPSVPYTTNDNTYVSNATNYTASSDDTYNATNATNYNNANNDGNNYYPSDNEDYYSASQMPTLSFIVIALAVFLL